MSAVHVQATAVWQHLVDGAVVLLAGPLPLAADLESPGIQQRILTRVIPHGSERLTRGERVDEEDGAADGVEAGGIPGRDPKRRLAPHDLLDGHECVLLR